MTALLLAVDVGTASARAGVFDAAGALLATGAQGFEVMRPQEGHVVYRSDIIWNAVCAAVRACLAVDPGMAPRIAGMAFDATASLVLQHDGAAPLDGGADTFCWMDHRAAAEAAEVAATGDRWLDYMGGAVSPENHLPKLMWLKHRAPEAWGRVTAVRDLCDELARRATGFDGHALAALSSKWPHLPHDEDPWRHDLLDQIGLDDVWGMGGLAGDPLPVGAVHGRLLPDVASYLGLAPGLPVSAGMIDAQAGLLGVLGRNPRGRADNTLTLIGGTSTCLMALSATERAIPGVWGPFHGAILPGLWLTEAGQSFAGAALDAVLEHHPGGPRMAAPELHASTAAEVLDLLEREGPAFAAGRHLVPDWLGNRAPLNDGTLRALVTGLGEDLGYRAFLETYYATARGLALQVRHIIAHLNANGFAIDRVALAGGHARSPLFEQLYRDALGPTNLVLSRTAEPVLLGTAMAAAVAAGVHPDLFAAVDLMSPQQTRLSPDPFWRQAHDAAYGIYLRLYEARNGAAHDAMVLAALTR